MDKTVAIIDVLNWIHQDLLRLINTPEIQDEVLDSLVTNTEYLMNLHEKEKNANG